MNITLRQLQIFLAVAQKENLTAASESLFLTKGAVSQGLLELEKNLGVKLFDRIHPHLRLNHEGKVLRPLADEILQRAQVAERLFGSGENKYLNVGASKTIATYILPQIMREFFEKYGWMPEVHMANTSELLNQLSSFSLDVVLLEGESFRPDVLTETWIEDAMVVLAHKAHPLHSGGPHPVEALKGEGWILREAASGTRTFFEHTLGALIAPYRIVQSLEAPEAVLGMVAQGLGITFASRVIAEMPDFSRRCAIVPLDRQFSRRFSICYHAQKHLSPGMEEFLVFCRQWAPHR